MKWRKFDREKSRGRWLPKPYRQVLVQCLPTDSMSSPAVAVGYMKFAAGDRQCPHFVVPGVGNGGGVVAWCDCLGDDFKAPLWALGNGDR